MHLPYSLFFVYIEEPTKLLAKTLVKTNTKLHVSDTSELVGFSINLTTLTDSCSKKSSWTELKAERFGKLRM